MKSRGAGDTAKMLEAAETGNKLSFVIYTFFAIPFVVECPFILSIWLDNVPAHTSNFIRIILLISIWDSTANALIISAQATGRVKKYQSVVGAIILLIVPISYLSLKICPIPEIVLIIHFFIAIGCSKINRHCYFSK